MCIYWWRNESFNHSWLVINAIDMSLYSKSLSYHSYMSLFEMLPELSHAMAFSAAFNVFLSVWFYLSYFILISKYFYINRCVTEASQKPLEKNKPFYHYEEYPPQHQPTLHLPCRQRKNIQHNHDPSQVPGIALLQNSACGWSSYSWLYFFQNHAFSNSHAANTEAWHLCSIIFYWSYDNGAYLAGPSCIRVSRRWRELDTCAATVVSPKRAKTRTQKKTNRNIKS